MGRHHSLLDQLKDAMRRADFEAALRACDALERGAPMDPQWPRRRADIHRRLGQRSAELDAWVRTAALCTDRGMVIQAIAASRMVLSIDPGHAATLEGLDRLCAQLVSTVTEAPLPVARAQLCEAPRRQRVDRASAPLDEIPLTKVLSGSATAVLGGDFLEGVCEIPLDVAPGDGDLDLELTGQELSPERSKSPGDPLHRVPLFGALDASTLRRLARKMRLIQIAEGECVFRQGDRADALYVVVEGAVVPIAEEDGEEVARLAVLDEGDFFGEIALVTNQPRNATIRALVDTRLLAIDRVLMWEVIRNEPSVLPVLLRFLRERLIDRLVRTSDIFGAFARAERAEVARHFRLLEIRDGTVLVEQGNPSPALFALLAGQMQVIYMDTDSDKVLGTLHPGDFCGERSMLGGEPAMAAVVASSKCWVLALPADRFRRILAQNPRLEALIARVAECRDRENADTLRGIGRPDHGGPGLI